MMLGDDEFWLHVPSAVCGLIKLLIVYRIGRLVHGRSVGLLGVILLVLSRYQVHYDQEARMYAPLGLRRKYGPKLVVERFERQREQP
jgi:uncharacterized membrane protein